MARELLLSARIFDAEEARRLGLVTEVVPREALRARAAELAAELMGNSPEGMRATKRLLRAQQREWMEGALELSMEANFARLRRAAYHRLLWNFAGIIRPFMVRGQAEHEFLPANASCIS